MDRATPSVARARAAGSVTASAGGASPGGGRRGAVLAVEGSPSRAPEGTAERILRAALASFADRGYRETSLDALAVSLHVRKQTILYWFPSKEALLEAVVDGCAAELSTMLEASLEGAGGGWAKVEAVVRSVFRLSARRPEILGLVRETGRIGPPASTRFLTALRPLAERAAAFFEDEMDAGRLRRHDPNLLLVALYSTVIGMLTEVEVLRALGEEPTSRSLVRRRRELLDLLHAALVAGGLD